MVSIGLRQAAPGRIDHSANLANYALAILATALSLAVRTVLDPILGNYGLYLAIFPAVIFSAWYCGLWPSVVSTALAFIGETYWFVEPRRSMSISDTAFVISAFVYLLAALCLIWFAESSRRAMTEARMTNQRLDDLVKERASALNERTSQLEKRNADLAAC
jgi:K+-sensing histidine kinase KdpD